MTEAKGSGSQLSVKLSENVNKGKAYILEVREGIGKNVLSEVYEFDRLADLAEKLKSSRLLTAFHAPEVRTKKTKNSMPWYRSYAMQRY